MTDSHFEPIPTFIPHFIHGQFVPSLSEEYFDTINPDTNQRLAQVASGQDADIDRAVMSADNAWRQYWRDMAPKDRARYLHRVADSLEARAEVMALWESTDTGIPIRQTRGQIHRAADNFRFFAEMATRITGESFPNPPHFMNYSLRQPIGVAGLITPWNTPLMLETWKIAPCLAAGDTAVLKPAEWSPLTAYGLATVFQEADLPPGVLNIVQGLGEQAGAALVRHPRVPLISFTGETTTGQEIMRTGAAFLKRFSMELGGKSPVVVFADADIDRAIDAVLYGIYTLNGERCTAGSRLFVEDRIDPEFVDALMQRIPRISVGNPLDAATDIGPLIHPDHWARVKSYVDLAAAEGFTVATGGDRPGGQKHGNYLAPTLLTDVRPDMRVAQEEIFGPVLTVTAFHTETQALQWANDVRYGLASYVWTRDALRAQRFAHGIEAGMVWINSQNVRDLRTPFGGSKGSGLGREGGHYSFDFYTETKTVHVAAGSHAIPRLGI